LNDPISNDLAQIKNIFKLEINCPAKPVGGAFLFTRHAGQTKKQGHFLYCFFPDK